VAGHLNQIENEIFGFQSIPISKPQKCRSFFTDRRFWRSGNLMRAGVAGALNQIENEIFGFQSIPISKQQKCWSCFTDKWCFKSN
jgi:hypothetical protein